MRNIKYQIKIRNRILEIETTAFNQTDETKEMRILINDYWMSFFILGPHIPCFGILLEEKHVRKGVQIDARRKPNK